jgi:hypothetical protein
MYFHSLLQVQLVRLPPSGIHSCLQLVRCRKRGAKKGNTELAVSVGWIGGSPRVCRRSWEPTTEAATASILLLHSASRDA